MRVDERDAAVAEEPVQRGEPAKIQRMAHGEGDGRQPGRARLVDERAPRLGGDQRIPAVVEEPAHLGQDPELLAPEPERGLGVEDQTAVGTRGAPRFLDMLLPAPGHRRAPVHVARS
jgi:hypothetical protein